MELRGILQYKSKNGLWEGSVIKGIYDKRPPEFDP